jgi:Flp pilus assembly protein TadG
MRRCGRARRRAKPVRRPAGEQGAAVVEFSLVAVLLIMLLLGVIQVAVYLHIRNVATASAAEGARHAANADVAPEDGAARAEEILARGIGSETAARIRCTAGVDEGPESVQVSAVRCSGALPVFFAPLGEVLPLDVAGHAVEEGE